MSLRQQISCLLLGLAIVFVVTTYAVQYFVVMPTFADLERQAALRNAHRSVDALQRDIDFISNTANDWASWDESYEYVADHNEEFAAANLVDESFTNVQIDLFCFVDNEKKLVWGGARNRETMEWVEVPDLLKAILSPTSPLTTHASVDDVKQGLMLTSRGPILLASRPIITTKREGPIRGSIVMGRFLNESEVASLAERTHVKLRLWTTRQTDLSPEVRRQLDQCAESGKTQVEMASSRTARAYTLIDDLYGTPALLIEVDLPREISAQGNVSAYVATACSMAAGCLTLFAMWCVVQWRVIGPLRSMATHAVHIGSRNDLKGRIGSSRGDEIGALGREFDNMVKRLAESHKKLLDTAHRAGMAEIASEVLHNVGNAVNSANCSIDVLEEQLRSSKLDRLERAVALLSEQAPNAAEFFECDPRGPKLVEYFVDLNKSMQQEHSELCSELSRLDDTVRHIRDAISVQQVFAGRSDFRQDVELPLLIEEVLRMNRDLLRAHEVGVEVELPPLPELQLNKSKLTQILVNLIRNAVQAMKGTPSDARRLTIAGKLTEEGVLELEVSDTGMGFTDEVRGKLFNHGFTTSPEGNGFGLHYCANAMREVEGSITAQSEGPGKGATFRICMPEVLDRCSTLS